MLHDTQQNCQPPYCGMLQPCMSSPASTKSTTHLLELPGELALVIETGSRQIAPPVGTNLAQSTHAVPSTTSIQTVIMSAPFAELLSILLKFRPCSSRHST